MFAVKTMKAMETTVDNKGLVEFLQQVPDYRRPQGIRVPMPAFLTMVVLGYMSGRFAMQALARYMKDNESYFSDQFGLLHGVPGYTQIRTILESLDFAAVNREFYKWASQFIEPDEEDWLSIDGKAYNSTVTNAHDSNQDFHAMVSVFSRIRGIILSSRQYTNSKDSEIPTAQELIKELEQKGMVLTLDALHCQKKRRPISWMEEMTI